MSPSDKTNFHLDLEHPDGREVLCKSSIMNVMKRFEQIFAYGLLVIFTGIVVHAPLSVWLGTIFPDYALLIKSWKEILMLLLVPVAIVLVTHRKLWAEFSRDWIFRLLIAYAVLHLIILAFLWPGVAQAAAGLAIDLRYVLFFGLVYTLIRIVPEYKKPAIMTAIGGAVVVLGFAAMQLFLPANILTHIGYGDSTIQPYLTVDMNPDYVRVNSTLRGPNPLGAYAGMVLALVAAFLLLKKRRANDQKIVVLAGLLAVCGSVALWISYSRSSVVAGIIGVLVVITSARLRKIPRIVQVASVAVVLIGSMTLFALRDSSFVTNVILHDDPNVGGSVSSNQGHVDSLAAGLGRVVEQPFGAGIGSTGSASLLGTDGIIIENQYLFIAHEAGWLGLALYICIFGLVMWRLWRLRKDWLALGVFAGGVGLALIGLLQPVWADDTVSMIWWGLAAIAIIAKERNGRQSTK